MLEDAIKKTTDFHNSWKVEVDWLEEAEQKAYGEWKPCGLARTCQADVDAHEVSWREMNWAIALCKGLHFVGGILTSALIVCLLQALSFCWLLF